MIPPQLEILILLISLWLTFYVFSRVFNLERRGIDVSPLYMMIKTKRLNNFLARTAEKHPNFWRIYSNLGVVLTFPQMALAIYFLAGNLYRFLYSPQTATPVVPILPGVTINLNWFPYLLIAIGLAITVHELAHGIISSLEKIPVTSSGIIIAPITAGGFVEPDEETFQKSSLLSRLRVISVGSLTNLLVGILTIQLIFFLFAPPSGILVTNVVTEGPVEVAGLQDWDIIYSIDGYSTPTTVELTLLLREISPGKTVTLETSRATLTVKTVPNPQNNSIAYLGIQGIYAYNPLRIGEISPLITHNLALTLEWTSTIMVNLGILNMLPLFPLDGEAFVYNILKNRLKRGLKAARVAVSLFSLSLMGLNIGLTFLLYGLTPI